MKAGSPIDILGSYEPESEVAVTVSFPQVDGWEATVWGRGCRRGGGLALAENQRVRLGLRLPGPEAGAGPGGEGLP